MRVALTGGNGFVGGFLARALTARGDTLRCLLRPTSELGGLAGVPFTRVDGDVTDPASLPALVKDCDVVFHLAGVRRGSSRDDFMRVNAEGTRHVADAMVAHGARRLVLCGSLAAAGPSRGAPKREDEPFEPQEWYGESKAEAERITLSYADRLEVTVSRPCRIVGPLDKENFTFVKLAARGLVLKLGGPERRLSFVDVEDTVAHLLLLGDRPEAKGQVFFCAADETRTVEEFLREVVALLGKTPKLVPVPEAVLLGVGKAADVASKVLCRKLPLNEKLARQLLAPGWVCSTEKSKRLLGFAPLWPLAKSIARSVESYRAAGWI